MVHSMARSAGQACAASLSPSAAESYSPPYEAKIFVQCRRLDERPSRELGQYFAQLSVRCFVLDPGIAYAGTKLGEQRGDSVLAPLRTMTTILCAPEPSMKEANTLPGLALGQLAQEFSSHPRTSNPAEAIVSGGTGQTEAGHRGGEIRANRWK